MQWRKPFCPEWAPPSHEDSGQPSEYLTSGQDRIPIVISCNFFYLRHTDRKKAKERKQNNALMLELKCKSWGSKETACYFLYVLSARISCLVSASDSKPSWHKEVKSQLWGSLYFLVFCVFRNRKLFHVKQSSMHWFWSLVGVCKHVVVAVTVMAVK